MAIRNYTVGTTPTAYFTSTGDMVVTPLYLHNVTNTTVTANLFLVDNRTGNAVASSINQIYGNLQIAAGDTYVVDTEKVILSNGDFIAASCSTTNALTMTISFTGV